MRKELHDIRKDYGKQTLSEADLGSNPIEAFRLWLHQAISYPCPEPTAMVLSTVSNSGIPSARVVLLKDIDLQGRFCFFTNYNSRKGNEITNNPNVCLTFFWADLERQVRIVGTVEKGSDKLSREYFASRPFASQLGAMVSPQSEPIESKQWLNLKYQEVRKFNKPIKPEHWGAYLITANEIEFWQGGKNRLHDRIYYRKKNGWEVSRLAP